MSIYDDAKMFGRIVKQLIVNFSLLIVFGLCLILMGIWIFIWPIEMSKEKIKEFRKNIKKIKAESHDV